MLLVKSIAYSQLFFIRAINLYLDTLQVYLHFTGFFFIIHANNEGLKASINCIHIYIYNYYGTFLSSIKYYLGEWKWKNQRKL